MSVDIKTWVTELNALAIGILVLLPELGVNMPSKAALAILAILNILLRIANKNGWIGKIE